VSELLEIPPEQIATIGDMANDVLMFRKSGFSIAMGNASDEVKNQARAVTDSNEGRGVRPRRCGGSSWAPARLIAIRHEPGSRSPASKIHVRSANAT